MFSNSYNKQIQDEVKAVNERFILHQNRTGREAYGSGYSMVQLQKKPVLNMVHKKQYGGGFLDDVLDGLTGAVDFFEKGAKVKKILKGKGIDDMDDVDYDYEAQSGGKKYTRRVGRGVARDLIEAEGSGLKLNFHKKTKKGGVFSGGVYSGGASTGGKRKVGRPRKGGASTGGKRKVGRPRKGGAFRGVDISDNDLAADIESGKTKDFTMTNNTDKFSAPIDPSLEVGSPAYYQALYQKQQRDIPMADAANKASRDAARLEDEKRVWRLENPSESQKWKNSFNAVFGAIPKIAKVASFVAPLVGLGKKGAKGKKGGESDWIRHVKKVQAQKGCSYKDAMTMAKKTYKK